MNGGMSGFVSSKMPCSLNGRMSGGMNDNGRMTGTVSDRMRATAAGTICGRMSVTETDRMTGTEASTVSVRMTLTVFMCASRCCFKANR